MALRQVREGHHKKKRGKKNLFGSLALCVLGEFLVFCDTSQFSFQVQSRRRACDCMVYVARHKVKLFALF